MVRLARIACVGWFSAALLALASLGCSASAQKPAIATVMDDEKLRREMLEATLRVTDEHPEYVDELFAMTLEHPKTLDRFLQNTSARLHEEKLSRMTARRLVEQPPGLRQILIASLDAASDEPPALDAIAEAMHDRPQIAAIAVIQRDESVRAVLRALMKEVLKNGKARAAFLTALQENSAEMAQVLVANPETLAALLEAFGKVGVAKGKDELEALIRALSPKDD